MNIREFYKISWNVIFRIYKDSNEAWNVYRSVVNKLSDKQAHDLCTDIIAYYGHDLRG